MKTESIVESSNPGEAQDLLMEAAFILNFLEESVCHTNEAEQAIHETSGLIYILRDIRDRTEKADQIIDRYKAEQGGRDEPKP